MRDLARMFERGARSKDAHASYTVKLVELAPVALPTGRIYAGDPFTLARLEPFERRVKPGTYAVTASIAKIAPLKKGRAQERVAAVMLRIGKGTAAPATWVNATKKAQKLSKLKDGAFFGYGVDSGTGCFCDLSAALALKALDEVEHANDNWDGWLMAKLRKGMLESKQAWGSGSAITVPDTRANVVAFSSGWGDGFYGSWWGLSKKGEPLCLVTDFGVLPEPPPARVVSRP